MCGLFGFVAKEKVPLNLETFIHLGCDNDTRGGDSVGVFIDKVVEYGIGKEKLFKDFYETSKLLETQKSVHVAVGHARKASVGAIGLATAQPVVIRNAQQDVEFVLLHNGTLTNHDDLQKKYLSKVPKHFTDSQIMAYCLYFHGTKILEEYRGAGMFIMIDYRNNKKYPLVKFFKGGSKEWASCKVEEERPLWVLKTDKGLWFSSIHRALDIYAHGTKFEVEILPMNILYTFQNGELINEEEIDRSEFVQKSYAPVTGFRGGNSNTNHCSTVDDYRNYEDAYVGAGYKDYENTGKNTKSTVINYISALPGLVSGMPDKLEYIHGKYSLNAITCDGEKFLSNYGFSPKIVVPTIHSAFYFVAGVLVYGKNVYEALKAFQKEHNYSNTDMLDKYSHILFNYSPSIKYDVTLKLCYAVKDYDISLYNGEYAPLFVPILPTIYTIKAGSIVSGMDSDWPGQSKRIEDYVAACAQHDTEKTVEEYLTEFNCNLS